MKSENICLSSNIVRKLATLLLSKKKRFNVAHQRCVGPANNAESKPPTIPLQLHLALLLHLLLLHLADGHDAEVNDHHLQHLHHHRLNNG